MLINAGFLKYSKEIEPSSRTPLIDTAQFSEIYLGVKTKLAVNSYLFPVISIGVGRYFNNDKRAFDRLLDQDEFRATHLKYGMGLQFVIDKHIGEFNVGASNGIYLGVSYGYQI